MKKKILILLSVSVLLLLIMPVPVHASETKTDGRDAMDILNEAKQQLSAFFDNIDKETGEEAFAFAKDKVREGNLDSEEGLLAAIEEGKEKFGVEIRKEDAQKLVDTMEKLENMGFSAEYVVEKAESLYQQYGSDFVEHVDEVAAGAVKNAASNAVGSFFGNLKSSIKNFFQSLFS